MPVSIIQRLRAAQIGEQIANLFFREVFQLAFGHQGFLLGDQFVNVGAGERLCLESSESGDVFV